MKIAVIGANGRAGQKIVAEAVNRGLDVTAVVRGENKSVAKNFLKKNIMDLTKDDLKILMLLLMRLELGKLKIFRNTRLQASIFAIF